MSVKYKLIPKGNPSDASAPKKFYASAQTTGKVEIKEIAKDIEDISSLSYGDIQNVLINLMRQIPKYLANGNSVKLGELGSFRISFSSEGVEKKNEFNTKKIKGQKIIFTPGAELKESLTKLKFEKA